MALVFFLLFLFSFDDRTGCICYHFLGAATETDVAGYRLYLMNQADSSDIKQLTDVKVPTTTATVTVAVTNSGSYVIVGTVYDNAGNESVKSSAAVDSGGKVVVFKDTTPPDTMKTLTITSVSVDKGTSAAAPPK